ncbi:MAG: hypothetical protein ACFE9D_11100, partial [Promethearchaeota archaeon]
ESAIGLSDEHAWMAKIDLFGEVEWERSYSPNHRGWGQAVIECDNGDLVVAGAVDDEFSNVLIFRTDQLGYLLWERILNFTEHQEAYAVAELPSGDLIVCGWAWHYRPTNPVDGLVIKLDRDGSLYWHREYGGLGDEYLYSVIEDSGQGLVFVGSSESLDDNGVRMWAVNTAFDGAVKWERTFGNSAYSRGNSIIVTGAGEFTIAGVMQDMGNSRLDSYIVHTAPDGTVLWIQQLGLETDNIAHCITACSDGGYVMIGEVSHTENSPWHDIIVVRFDNDGQILWQKLYGGEGNDVGISIVECGGNLVFAGSTTSYGFLSGTTWLSQIPDAPPSPVDPHRLGIPVIASGLIFALIVLAVMGGIYLTSRKEIKHRIRDNA